MTRTKYNFAPASGRDGELVFGSERPAAADDFNKPGAISPKEVEDWAKFMLNQGIVRSLCLLNAEELSYFAEPGYIGGLTAAGFAPDKVACVDVFTPGAAERTAAALMAAKAAGERLVLHCAGGEGRTGTVLAQWLRMEQLGDSEAVCAGLVAFSGGVGAVRKPNAAKVDRYLEAGTLGK